MISPRLEQLLNEQMQAEFNSAYLYLAMQSWFEERALSGFANWYGVQTQEERDHAMRIRAYLVRVDGTPRFLEIKEPDQDFSGIADILQRTLAHEQLVTSLINKLMDSAQAEHDYKTIQFLDWYVTEQVEEEENVRSLIDRFKIADESEAGTLIMDTELSSRQYKAVSASPSNS